MEFLLAGLVVLLLVDRAVDRRSRDAERESARAERAELAQRIQAPEVAVVQHAAEMPGLQYVPTDGVEADELFFQDRAEVLSGPAE